MDKEDLRIVYGFHQLVGKAIAEVHDELCALRYLLFMKGIIKMTELDAADKRLKAVDADTEAKEEKLVLGGPQLHELFLNILELEKEIKEMDGEG